jgi:hypothetical protein
VGNNIGNWFIAAITGTAIAAVGAVALAAAVPGDSAVTIDDAAQAVINTCVDDKPDNVARCIDRSTGVVMLAQQSAGQTVLGDDGQPLRGPLAPSQITDRAMQIWLEQQ